EGILEPAFSATFSVASDQAGKLGFGKNKMILSTFEQYQIVQFNHSPLILTLLASANANTGMF
ncbi:Ragulator complex protein LAMTOR3, partial [Blyttiomyces helicus]